MQMRTVYSIPGMERARVRKDLVYKTADGKPLKLDLYYPADAGDDKPLPAVILVHGEWPPEIIEHSKETGGFVSTGQLIAASGLVAVNFNHRATERLTRLHEAAGDVRDLITYLRDNAATLGVDRDRLCVWVFSAGMPLGMWAAMHDTPSYVRCIVGYYGVMDLESVRKSLPGKVSKEELREFSALHHLREHPKEIAPTFLAKAGRDRPGLIGTIDLFTEEAHRLGANVEVMAHEDGQHGFDVLDDDACSREIIKRTLEFITENI